MTANGRAPEPQPPRPGVGAIVLLLTAALALGCRFDADYQHDIRFPASLVLINETGVPLTIAAVLSLPDAEATFVLKGATLAPGETLRRRVTEHAYKVLLDGAFVLRGACLGRPPWEVAGSSLAREGVHDDQRWDLTVPIRTCEP